ncbi:MAG: lipocalin-like domain-containing protein [Gammaproteobacteria bacterium]
MTPLRLLAAAAAIALAAATAIALRSQPPPPVPNPANAVARALRAGATDAGFARARAPRAFAFPDDHGPHPDFRTEWWYFTGNLQAADGRRFGYQLTLFRIALAAREPPPGNPWRTRQMWMGHFALTDAAQGGFHAAERFAREALGIAGAVAAGPQLRLRDWRIAFDPVPQGATSIRLRARDGAHAIALDLRTTRPVVAHGDRGLSVKSDDPGNASYYYSIPRLETRGSVTTAGETHAVSGTSWLDREWSSGALGREQSGWDWLALHLDDGRDLMLYRLRRADGGTDPHSAGTMVLADGTALPLRAGDFDLRPTGHWTSPASGARYPLRWDLAIASQGIRLGIEPLVERQELNLALRYWEGAVSARGTHAGRPLRARGYLELTGY